MSVSRTRSARTAPKPEARPEILSHSVARVRDSSQLERSIRRAIGCSSWRRTARFPPNTF